MKIIMLGFAIIVTLAGCASVSHQIDRTTVSKIKEGQTTKQQVYDLCGSPDSVTNLGAGDSYWSYFYVRAQAKNVGKLVGGSKYDGQYLMIVFGPDNIVKKIIGSHSMTDSDLGVNTGSKPDTPDIEENKQP